MVVKINFVPTSNQSIECESIPSYLKLIPHPKFNIFFFSAGPISIEVHIQINIVISESSLIFPQFWIKALQ